MESPECRHYWADDASGLGRLWTVAAVCVAATSILLLLRGLETRADAELLPGYAVAYILVGLCMFGPDIRAASWGQLLTFVLPGCAMVALWALGAGYWGGLWLLGLPAWAIICRRWGAWDRRQQAVKPVLFVAALIASALFFVLSGFYPVFGPVLLAAVPMVSPVLFIASHAYRRQPLRAAAEFLLSCAVVAVALALPSSSWLSPPGLAAAAVLTGLLMAVWAGRRGRNVRAVAA
jgi:hypothetical protein